MNKCAETSAHNNSIISWKQSIPLWNKAEMLLAAIILLIFYKIGRRFCGLYIISSKYANVWLKFMASVIALAPSYHEIKWWLIYHLKYPPRHCGEATASVQPWSTRKMREWLWEHRPFHLLPSIQISTPALLSTYYLRLSSSFSWKRWGILITGDTCRRR